jgi:predicted Rossmann-fold nucleotide-binding protein
MTPALVSAGSPFLTTTRLHQKPCGLLNGACYFDPLIAFLDHAMAERFLRPEHRAMVLVEEEPEELVERLQRHGVVQREKWIDPSSR